MRTKVSVLGVALVLSACAARATPVERSAIDEPTAAVQEGTAGGAGQAEGRSVRGSKGPHEDFHRHSFSAFLGDTFDANDNGITGGLDYEYRISHLIGVGAFVDRAWGDFNSTLIGGAVFVHPWRELVVMGGLGSEREDGENSLAGRVGVGYEIPVVDRYSVIPWAYLDFTEGEGAHSGVVGVAFGVGF